MDSNYCYYDFKVLFDGAIRHLSIISCCIYLAYDAVFATNVPLYLVYFTPLQSVCVFFFLNIKNEVNVTNSLLTLANDASLKSKALLRISK